MRELPSSNLYRIVSFDRAVQLLKTNELYFAHPSSWDDPYEKGLIHQDAQRLFAQCWCRKAVSDAMWRIYSTNSLGVRIGTTHTQLEAALSQAKASQGISFKIQKVKYVYQEELDFELQRIEKSLKSRHSVSTAMSQLFLKRRAFSHESETRAVIYASSVGDEERKAFVVKVDARNLINSIWIDPRAPQEYVDAFTSYLKKELKFKGVVKKSSLYAARSPLEASES
jgi:hypothetical protein